MDQGWSDPQSPWWVKLRRAQVHIDEVQQRVAVLQDAEPWSILRELADSDGWAYLFRVHQPIPADLSAAEGTQ